MRRSKAPSQKLNSFSNPKSEIKEFTSSVSSYGDTTLKPRSTESILDILNTNVDDLPTKNENFNDSDTLINCDNGDECKSMDDKEKTSGFNRPTEDIQTALGGDHSVNNDIRKFNVVYGKQSKKKHKTWEGDGILELHGNAVTLKDSDGKVLGRASGKKYANLEEGAQLYVGNKEIEIIDEVKVQNNVLERKRPLEQKENCQLPQQVPAKKIKKITNSRKMVFNSPLVSNIADVKPLVMPRPDHEHQWKFNTNNAKINDVIVDGRLNSKLRPHQRDGVTFLYSCIVGLKNHKYTGAILADEMGLGKTLQTITLLWTLMKQGPYGIPLIQRALIVTPSSLVGNWNQEFIRWLGKERISTFIVDQKNKPCDYLKLPKIPVIIISYEMFVRYHEDISQIKFDLIVCDEGHRLKNNNIRTSLLLNQLECRRRIILTGTPIQNDLQEFHSLIDFVNPGILGAYAEFKRTFEEPIVKSRQPDVGEYILKKGEEKAQELNFKTSGFILRRTQALVNHYLPAKYETVVFCKPTDLQRMCYNKAAEFWESRLDKSDSDTSPVSHLSVMIAMKKISNHPLLVYASDSEEPDDLIVCLSDLLESSKSIFMLEDSSKLLVVHFLLQNLSKTNEKLVLVSYYTQTLDMLAELCKNFGYKFCRLDGATPSAQRITIVNKFNSKNSSDSVFLLSGKAGGTGLNLVGASRLVLFDSDWNPASDLQAMARIWRDGQTNSVFIYRLLTAGTIEEKIFQRQLSKASLSETVVDTVPSNSTVRLSRDELKDLFTVHDSPCLTHDLMECGCSCCGEILISKDEEGNKSESQNDYQLNIEAESSADSKPSLRMNQLFQWEHHASPFNADLLKEMALNGADERISFMFRNIISK